METRKTNLGVEYELEAYGTGLNDIQVLATFPQTSEWKEFNIKLIETDNREEISYTCDTSKISDDRLLEAQQYINEQAIMYVSMELAKLMGEGKIRTFKVYCVEELTISISTTIHFQRAAGLPQIEELIKQIRYSN